MFKYKWISDNFYLFMFTLFKSVNIDDLRFFTYQIFNKLYELKRI